MSYVQLMNNARFCMNSKCWYLVIISLFYSCNKEPVEDPLKDFTSNQTVKLEYSRKIDLEQYGVLKPASILKCTDGYMISSQTNKAMFSRIYLDENRVITGVDRGNAPGELISPSSIQQMNGHVYVYDIGRKTIFEIQENLKDSLLTLSQYRTLEMDSRPFLINLLPNGHILASGIFHNSWVSYFDRENEMVSCLPFPTFDETDMLSDVSLSVLYLSTFTSVKPDGNKMVCATQTCGVLSFCTISPNAIAISKQIKYYPPEYNVPKPDHPGMIVYSRDNKAGFCAVASDDKHVFVLYSGRTFNSHNNLSHHCEHLLVYDWEGNPLRHIVLNKPLYSMSYDIENKIIYGIGYDPEGVIFEYELKNIVG